MNSSEYNCIFCKETFSDKETLQVHFRKHGDPTFNSNSKQKMGNTSEASSETPAKEAEMVSCDVCPESFPTISKAITHKHKMHPEHTAKYFCPWCGKLFTMKHLYNKHMQSTHESTVKSDEVFFHCDCCDVDFYVPSAMHNHNKFFHRQEADSHDLGQSKKLKSYDQQTYLLYYCSFCGEEYNNKVNLQKHNEDDHSDEDNSFTEVLRCPMCDAVFYHLDAYELHLCFHSADDVYSDELHPDFSTVTEFSLETVPPIMEKIENETMGSDNFLELAWADSLNNDDTGESSERVKSKKRKKHKKSKKEAITLDEFLNMNNIFGEGIDIQGIEEVPKQAITKQLKKRPKASNINAPSSTDLRKLKMQGITIKKKPNNVPIEGPKRIIQPSNMSKNSTKTSSINTSNDALNKLMNQTNNQIKIVKKSAQESKEKPVSPDTVDPASPKKMLKEADFNEENISTQETRQDVEKDQSQIDDELIPISQLKTKLDTSKSKNDVNSFEEPNDGHTVQGSSNKEIENPFDPLNSLKNLSSNITIKSVNQEKELLVRKSSEEVTTEYCGPDDNVGSASVSQKSTVSETPNKTLSALKHLSHLITVKPFNQNSTITEKQVCESAKDAKKDSREKVSNESPDDEGIIARNETIRQAVQAENKQEDESKTPLGTFRNMSQNVTVKPVKNVLMQNNPMCSSPKMTLTDKTNNCNDEDECEDYDEIILQTNAKKYSDAEKPQTVAGNVLNKIHNLSTLPDCESLSNNVVNVSKDINEDILKRLTTITAKPVSVMSNHNKSVTPSSNTVSTTKKAAGDFKITDEIFSIDDSDSDDREDALNNRNCKTAKIDLQNKHSTDILKAINKSISVKPIKQVKVERTSDDENMDALPETPTEDKTNNDEEIANNPINIKTKPNTILNNVLMNLSKNITIKSRNTSPSISKKLNEEELDEKNNCMNYDDFEDSDFDPCPGTVKITEVNDENASDDDQQQSNAIIETPNDTNSDTDFHSDHEQDLNDFESDDMHTNEEKLSKKPIDISQFKNLSKNIIIKSLNQSQAENNGVKDTTTTLPYVNKNSNLKSNNKQVTIKNDQINKIQRNMTGSSVSDTTLSKGSSQVNKQVKVQTYESETIIEEITTTVTKTIRKVNQTVQQQNVSQISSPVRGQKVLNMPTRLPGPNTQGVRQINPNFVPKIRPSIRSAVGTTVRPSNQLVPVRPSNQLVPSRPSNQLVTARLSNQLVPARPRMNFASSSPRMPNVRKTNPTTLNQQKPLRISSQVKLNQPQKRPTEETPGPFSCFKKPKESSQISGISSSQGDNVVQFASTSQSKSNFSSAKQVVKGNSVVTSTQTKSAMSASSQQLTRLSGMSGLKVVKTSLSKESVVEEKAEVSASKRSALEAIEKLQRQGLLVKKPCIDYNEYSEHSNSDVDE